MGENKLLTCQYIFPNAPPSYAAGFNSRVYGESYQEACGYPCAHDGNRISGWQKADDMVNEGKIYSIYRFKHLAFDKICKGISFSYGGQKVCNECGKARVDAPWWVVKIEKDGAAYCIKGENFENLQESDNYAFGDTKIEALNNYQNIYLQEPMEASIGGKEGA